MKLTIEVYRDERQPAGSVQAQLAYCLLDAAVSIGDADDETWLDFLREALEEVAGERRDALEEVAGERRDALDRTDELEAVFVFGRACRETLDNLWESWERFIVGVAERLGGGAGGHGLPLHPEPAPYQGHEAGGMNELALVLAALKA